MPTPHNKLVRDGIPDIIRASGRECAVRILSEAEYIRCLEQKLLEEANEYVRDRTMEELADVLEVVRALAEANGSDMARVEALRREKAEARGAFKDRLFLIEVS